MASTYGGLLFYKVENREKSFERIQVPNPFEVVFGNSGVTADASALGLFLTQLEEKDPELCAARLKTIRSQVYEMRNELEAGNLEKTGAIMNENHTILIEMGLSHKKLIDLCNIAIENGAFGAKVTGEAEEATWLL